MPALYLTKDLFFASRVTATARALGGEVQVVPHADALIQQAENDCSLVLLDLDTPGLDPAAVVNALKDLSDQPAIIAFGSHVHEARLQAARDAGCDAVLARGQFDRQMPEILRTYLSPT